MRGCSIIAGMLIACGVAYTSVPDAGVYKQYIVFYEITPRQSRKALNADGGRTQVIYEGDTLTMWVEHHDVGQTATLRLYDVDEVDVIVTCYPKELPRVMRRKHLLPDDPDEV